MPEGPLRVLYVHHVPLVGGAAASLLGLLRALPAGAVTALLACPGGAGGAGRAELPAWQPRWSAWPQVVAAQLGQRRALARAVADLAAAWRPQLIHANTWPAALAALDGPADAAPVLWHVRDLRVRPVVLRRLRDRCAAVIAISGAVREMLLAAGFAAERVHLVPNGLDPADLRLARPQEQVRAELGVAPGAPMILNLGQFVPWKRHDLLIAALPEVLGQAPGARLVLAGEEPPGGAAWLRGLRAQAQRRAVADAVRFAGYRRDAPDLLNACDVYAHGAEAEPFGRAVLEAMCLGRPVVAPAAAGPAELIQDGVSGLLVRPGSAAALAEGILRMLGEPALAAACGAAAAVRARERFSAQAMAEGVLRVYGAITAGLDRGGGGAT